MTLTALGTRLARQYWAEQQAMQSLFRGLGLPDRQAEEDALAAISFLSPQARAELLSLSIRSAASF